MIASTIARAIVPARVVVVDGNHFGSTDKHEINGYSDGLWEWWQCGAQGNSDKIGNNNDDGDAWNIEGIKSTFWSIF